MNESRFAGLPNRSINLSPSNLERFVLSAYFLLVKLPYTIEGLQKEAETLVASLPSGSKRVIYTNEATGFLLPNVDIPERLAVKLRKALEPFADWWVLGVTGTLVCKNGSMDPFRHWMNEFLGIVPAKRSKSKNVPLTQRWNPRGKASVDDLVDGTVGKVGLQDAPRQNGPQKAD